MTNVTVEVFDCSLNEREFYLISFKFLFSKNEKIGLSALKYLKLSVRPSVRPYVTEFFMHELVLGD